MYEHRSHPLLPKRLFYIRVAQHLGWVAVILGGSLALGMAGYMGIAHFGAVDAFLDAAMLLGGMGPVGTLPTDASKIFAGLYALYAGIVFIASAGILIAPIAHRLMHRLHLGK
jgi:hypothetical protein